MGEEENKAPSERYDPLIGTTLADRYEIIRRIGEGGMGAVYEARHTVIGKRVAVKVLLERLLEKRELVRRLLQEARMASSIGHENIVDVTDFGTTEDGRSFVVMEFLEGEPLSMLLAREAPLSVARSLHIVGQVASALHAAHDKGIVHRDIKPENVYLIRRDNRDFVKVVDFGVSKAVHGGEETSDSLRMTRTGTVLGTPLYMSPEQARGDEDIDARADIWAASILLYECLTGEVPFRARNYLQVISQVLSTEVLPPSRLQPEVGIPAAVDAIVMRGLVREREHRYQQMADLEGDIKRLLAGDQNVGAVAHHAGVAPEPGRNTAATRPTWYLMVAAVLAVGIGLTVALARVDPDAGVEARRTPPETIVSKPPVVPVAATAQPPTVLDPAVVEEPASPVTGTGATLVQVPPASTTDKRPAGPRRRPVARTTAEIPAESPLPGDGILRIGDDIVPGPEKAYRTPLKR